ncbi:MAG: hypothetical protein RQ750_18640, partial [Roseovarius sp.]|nr:hypothetical protein [Roseovarius sp.]
FVVLNHFTVPVGIPFSFVFGLCIPGECRAMRRRAARNDDCTVNVKIKRNPVTAAPRRAKTARIPAPDGG